MKTALLVDGNHLARRSFFTVGKTLRTAEGKASGAVFGSLNTLRKLALAFPAGSILVFFDGGHDEATKLYPEYKKNKDRNRDEEFYKQCNAFEDLITAFGLRRIQVSGVEADTLLGVATGDLSPFFDRVYVVSSDHDMYQLIRKNVRVYDDLHQKVVSRREVRERYPGLKPRDVIALKCFSGDSSDNIPGLPGIGKTTALALTQHIGGYAGLKGILDGAPLPDPEEFEPRIRARIAAAFAEEKAARKALAVAYKLVRIPTKRSQLKPHIRDQYVEQFEETPLPELDSVKQILGAYQIQSVLDRLEAWSLPLLRAGGHS